MEWREEIRAFIVQEAKPVEKFGHQPRLYALTREIGAGIDYDDDVVYAAAWLHDLGVFLGRRPADLEALARWDNVQYAMREAPRVLAGTSFPASKIGAVVEAIRTHQAAAETRTIEATILRDADILEQLGAIGITRAMCKVGRDTRYQSFTDVLPVLRTALGTLPSQLRLPVSRALAASRVELLAAFLQALKQEAGPDLH